MCISVYIYIHIYKQNQAQEKKLRLLDTSMKPIALLALSCPTRTPWVCKIRNVILTELSDTNLSAKTAIERNETNAHLHEKLDAVEGSGDGFRGGAGDGASEEQSGVFRHQCPHREWMLKKLSRRRREFPVEFPFCHRHACEITAFATAGCEVEDDDAVSERRNDVVGGGFEDRDFAPRQRGSLLGFCHVGNLKRC